MSIGGFNSFDGVTARCLEHDRSYRSTELVTRSGNLAMGMVELIPSISGWLFFG